MNNKKCNKSLIPYRAVILVVAVMCLCATGFATRAYATDPYIPLSYTDDWGALHYGLSLAVTNYGHDFTLSQGNNGMTPHDSISNSISVNGAGEVPFTTFFSPPESAPTYFGDYTNGDGGVRTSLTAPDGLEVTAQTYLRDFGVSAEGWSQNQNSPPSEIYSWSNAWYWRQSMTFRNTTDEAMQVQYYLYWDTDNNGLAAWYTGRHLWYSENYGIEPFGPPCGGSSTYYDFWADGSLMGGTPSWEYPWFNYYDSTNPDDAISAWEINGGTPGIAYGQGFQMMVMFDFSLNPGETKTVQFENAPLVPEPGTIVLIGCGLVGLAGVVRRRLR